MTLPEIISDPMKPVAALYSDLLSAWNHRSARDYAALFTEDGLAVGFDGSVMHGRSEIETELARIFTDHETAAYLGIIRSLRLLAPGVAALHAVAGMVPPGQADINPAVNTIQTLIAVRGADGWRIAQYQNTPAQFHGRPDLSAALTEELRAILRGLE